MKRFSSIAIPITCLILLVTLLLPAQQAQAHGGFVLESGEIDNYEWAVSIFPYPVVTGASVLSILIFDKSTNAAATNLTGEVYLAEPGDTRPCCEPGIHRGPFVLTSDQNLYPGDYTTFIPVDATGRWQMLFKMTAPSGDYGIVSGFDAIPYGDGSQPVDKPAIATQVSIAFNAAVNSIAQRSASTNALSTEQPTSPLVQSNSPLTAPNVSGQVANTPANNGSATNSTVQTSDLPPPGSNRLFLIAGGLGLVVVLGAAFMLFAGKDRTK